MESKNLVKTDKVIMVNPENLLTLYRYAKYYIKWESEEFIKKLREIYPLVRESNYYDYYEKVQFVKKDNIEEGIRFYIPLNYVLLPTYLHIYVPEPYKNIIKSKKSDVIDINEFSLFNVYQVVDDVNGRFSLVKLGVSIEYRDNIDCYGVKALEVFAKDKYIKSPQDFLIMSVFHDLIREEDKFAGYLKIIKKLQGTKYSELEEYQERNYFYRIKEDILDIFWLEESLITTINLINALYTNEFDENDIIGQLLKPYSDTFKGFGCKFEEVLPAAAGVISAFLF